MQVLIEESKKLRRASACIRDGGTIHVKLPRHWPKHMKYSVTEELVERLRKKDIKERELLDLAARQETLTIGSQSELEAWVKQVNAETFQVPLGKVRLGYAKYNHLAQVNLRTKTMTVSKYCLKNVPQQALRYLIVHELAHYFESGHGPQFWALVAKHVPDYRLQSRIMKAFHHQAVIAEEAIEKPDLSELAPTPLKGNASKPVPARTRKKAVEPKPTPNGLIPGFIRQLILWGEQ